MIAGASHRLVPRDALRRSFLHNVSRIALPIPSLLQLPTRFPRKPPAMFSGRHSRLLRQCRIHYRPETIPRPGTLPPPGHLIRHPRPTSGKVQSFHTTISKNAARSPIARNTQSRRVRSPMSEEGIFQRIVDGNLPQSLQRLEANAEYHYEKWKETYGFSGSYERGKVSLQVYKRVAKTLLQTAYSEPPSARAIRNISTDVDTIWNISKCLFDPANDAIYFWLVSACALAGSPTPSLLVANVYLSMLNQNEYPLRTQILDQVETMALRNHEPRAMLLQSRVLIKRGEYKDAMALMDHLMTVIYPANRVEGAETPLTFQKWTPLPDVYTKLQQKLKEQGIDWGLSEEESLRLFAVDYQIPAHLPAYASMMFRKGDLEAYERYMNQAATAGVSGACHSLGSFYYLTARGRFPRRGDVGFVQPADGILDAEPCWESSWSQYLQGVHSYKHYDRLARQWFELGMAGKDDRSSLILALLHRRAGNFGTAQKCYESLKHSPRQAVDRLTADELALCWTNPYHIIEVPECLLQVEYHPDHAEWGELPGYNVYVR
ncbi:hypothetical protein BO94DRAFT_397346 [Aspergillus sclerotioniger CBS 115572]|uniref:Uncharacterized protein n=1 Tax=Aspergillus sclerotioniger CBS 115572 TaxID=1450535 RepID=A0A317WYX0_9EURO|nr:hypothetical protein BO94DRAFT_397346 [Aspergillus sclerotioniger CBS 115572]PWY91569.1 hypothetical protein BO94DRAFT_397346 [Aspergillus sclerotioniger CBS 115572]